MAGGTITSPTASVSLSSSRWIWVTIERRSWPFSFSRAPQSFRITYSAAPLAKVALLSSTEMPAISTDWSTPGVASEILLASANARWVRSREAPSGRVKATMT